MLSYTKTRTHTPTLAHAHVCTLTDIWYSVPQSVLLLHWKHFILCCVSCNFFLSARMLLLGKFLNIWSVFVPFVSTFTKFNTQGIKEMRQCKAVEEKRNHNTAVVRVLLSVILSLSLSLLIKHTHTLEQRQAHVHTRAYTHTLVHTHTHTHTHTHVHTLTHIHTLSLFLSLTLTRFLSFSVSCSLFLSAHVLTHIHVHTQRLLFLFWFSEWLSLCRCKSKDVFGVFTGLLPSLVILITRNVIMLTTQAAEKERQCKVLRYFLVRKKVMKTVWLHQWHVLMILLTRSISVERQLREEILFSCLFLRFQVSLSCLFARAWTLSLLCALAVVCTHSLSHMHNHPHSLTHAHPTRTLPRRWACIDSSDTCCYHTGSKRRATAHGCRLGAKAQGCWGQGVTSCDCV